MKIRLLHIAFVLLSLSACQREQVVDLDVPQKSKLVGAVYVGAGTSSVMASVTRTVPVIGTPESFEPKFVANATGTLTDLGTSETWPFAFDAMNNQYSTTLNTSTVEAGRQYRVQFSDDYETVTGTTTVPLPITTSVSVKLDSVLGEGMINSYTAAITCTLLTEGTHNIRLVPVIIFNDTIPYPMTDVFNTEPVYTINKGGSFSHTFSVPYGYGETVPTGIEVMVLSCDEAYTRYFNSTGFSYDQFGPLSDPSIVYSNMSNNVGVIASYNISETHTIPLH